MAPGMVRSMKEPAMMINNRIPLFRNMALAMIIVWFLSIKIARYQEINPVSEGTNKTIKVGKR